MRRLFKTTDKAAADAWQRQQRWAMTPQERLTVVAQLYRIGVELAHIQAGFFQQRAFGAHGLRFVLSGIHPVGEQRGQQPVVYFRFLLMRFFGSCLIFLFIVCIFFLMIN